MSPDIFTADVVLDELLSSRMLVESLQGRIDDLKSQKRALLDTVADLQAVVRLLSQDRLRVA